MGPVTGEIEDAEFGQVGKQAGLDLQPCAEIYSAVLLNASCPTIDSTIWNGRLRPRQPSIRIRKLKEAKPSSRLSLFTVQNFDLKDFRKQLKAVKRKRPKDETPLKPEDSENKEPSSKKFMKAVRTKSSVMSSSVETSVPQSPSQRRKAGGLVQRSFSLRVGSAKDEDFAKKYRIVPTPVKKRANKLWSDTVSKGHVQTLSPMQLRRQEAIYELSSGEEDVVSDLTMMQEVYYKPMYKLKLMSEYEFTTIFGYIETLLEIHSDIIVKLKAARSSADGMTDSIGQIMLEWFPRLSCYVKYCANQFEAKAMLDEKMKSDNNVKDFLQRCQASPFSRKLDLWSFLDSPRSRLVKYPLMLKSIMKLTPRDHPDRKLLEDAIACIETIIEDVDQKTGEAKCQCVLSRIVFLYDNQMCPELFKSKRLLCSGVLKNKHGTKLHAFLFEKVFLLTRPATRGGRSSYQVFTEPLLAEYLFVEDLPDGDVRLGGSFKTAISRLATSRNVLRISSTDRHNGQSHTLQASSEPDKRQWLNALRSIVSSENYKTFI
ncbi:neuroepithelial cell-transforming gene 1 protein isoform X2 [Nematostella vectensis]|uniref:neuroepithelial cell-transforming gene 1 protein isoform X2 n=1 Tax=Nematostella vectensis TaxID=45351 RepID=UPI0020775A26|nr:neuroepithelial cell-transforming gene 1 protein isoform X2 [Nematostella vectensis]